MSATERGVSGTGTYFGSSVKSKEGNRLIRGRGEYLANLHLPGTLHAVFLRSPHAHARIVSIDTTHARELPGVHAVIVAADMLETTEPILSCDVMRLGPPFEELATFPTYWALSHDEVHYVGDPIAMVVAESRHIAEDALDDIDVDYEVLEAVVDPEAALEPGAALTYTDWESNLGLHIETTVGDVDWVFGEADRVVKHRFSMHRAGCPPLENMVAIASWDDRQGLTLWLNTQRVHVVKIAISEILHVPAALVRVIAPPDIGGAFGWKAAVYREPFAVTFAALRLKRPVTWIQDRREALEGGGHERDGILDIEGAFGAGGKLRALRLRQIGDCGCAKVDQYHYLGPMIAALVPTPYELEAYEAKVDCVVTNKAPIVVNRPAGRMPCVFALERFMDLSARELGIDTVEIRRINLIKHHPYEAPGMILHGDFMGVLEQLLRDMDYPALRERVAAERQRGRHLGVGVAVAVDLATPYSSAGLGWVAYHQPFYATARVKIETDGDVVIYAGDSPQGQGRETTVAQAAADQLGVEPEAVRVFFGDTANSPLNNHAVHTQTAVHIAAQRLREKVLAIGAHMLGLPTDSCEVRGGGVIDASDPEHGVTLHEVARTAWLNVGALPPGVQPMLEEIGFDELGLSSTNSFSAHGCLVEVFPDTGEYKIEDWWYVGDAGRVMNPRMLEGAIHGGVACGISNASFEHYAYDGNGQFLAATMMDYLMAGPMDVTHVHSSHHNTPVETTRLGFKKMVTEGVPAGVPPALVDAVEDALKPLDVRFTALPLTPSRLWEAIELARSQNGGERSNAAVTSTTTQTL